MKNLSSSDISDAGRVTIAVDSLEAILLNPGLGKLVNGQFSKVPLGSSTDFGDGGGGGGGNGDNNPAPTLEDIVLISKGTKINDKGQTRSTLTIRVRNSSGVSLKAVDAAFAAQAGGA